MSSPANNEVVSTSSRLRVWDLFVRVFHWSVAAGFFIAYFTEDDFMLLHVWTGYLVGALVAMRIVWGFIGPKYARFYDFIYSPFTVFIMRLSSKSMGLCLRIPDNRFFCFGTLSYRSLHFKQVLG